MSKSLGNFFTLRDLTAKGFQGREIRQLLISAHYRETFNFTLDGLAGARSALTRIDECVDKLREIAGSQTAPADAAVLAAFTESMDDDLNVARAWAVVFDWVRETNRQLAAKTMTTVQAASALAGWTQINSVLGLGRRVAEEAPAELMALAQERVLAKKAKDFAKADQLRQQVKAQGWVIEDTPTGPRLKRG